MSEFIVWAEREGYKNIKIIRLKKIDKISVETTERTGYPNIKKIILTLKHHIEEVPIEHYSQLLLSLEDRARPSSLASEQEASSPSCTKQETKQ